MIAEKWDITRDDMEAFAVESHERAIRARAEGRFEGQIAPLGEVAADEGPREPNWDKIRSLPTLTEGGRVTAACASQISDASAALLIVNQKGLAAHGLTPRARIHHVSVRADDPVWMLTAPIPATAYALEKTGMTLDDIDLVEINEAFASVVLAWAEGDRRGPGQGQRQRRRHRPGPPARRHRRPPDDHPAGRAGAHRRPLRPADDVRGRRPGQRHDRRTSLTRAVSSGTCG